MGPMGRYDLAIFDLDGTLIDSDEALVQPFLKLGLTREEITFGHPIEEFCAHKGLRVEDYAAHYDTTSVLPFPGADELVAALDRWAICSNKWNDSAQAELERLGWKPEVALFSRDFDGREKSLAPVLERLGVGPERVVYVGDSGTDAAVAVEAGVEFLWAGWNPRTAAAKPEGTVLAHPLEVLDHLR